MVKETLHGVLLGYFLVVLAVTILRVLLGLALMLVFLSLEALVIIKLTMMFVTFKSIESNKHHG